MRSNLRYCWWGDRSNIQVKHQFSSNSGVHTANTISILRIRIGRAITDWRAEMFIDISKNEIHFKQIWNSHSSYQQFKPSTRISSYRIDLIDGREDTVIKHSDIALFHKNSQTLFILLYVHSYPCRPSWRYHGQTLFYTSHDYSFMEKLCSRIACYSFLPLVLRHSDWCTVHNIHVFNRAQWIERYTHSCKILRRHKPNNNVDVLAQHAIWRYQCAEVVNVVTATWTFDWAAFHPNSMPASMLIFSPFHSSNSNICREW